MADIDEQFDYNQKKQILDIISETVSLNRELILSIQEMARIANTNRDIPNIGITINNKIIELSQEFQRAGISMFSSKRENCEPTESFVGDSLMIDMMNLQMEGIDMLGVYTSRFTELLERKRGKGKTLEKSGPAKRFVLKITGWINAFLGETILYTQEERKELNSYLSEYKKIDEQLWNYNVRENIIASILAHIKRIGCNKMKASQVLRDDIIPDMQKLGLGDLIPELKQELKQAFGKEDDKSWVLQSDERDEIQAKQTKTGKAYCNTTKVKDKTEPINTDKYTGEEPI